MPSGQAAQATLRIHPTAEVEENVSIGPDTSLWRHVHVMSGAVIGARCVLGQGCFVASGVRIGDGCRVQNNVSLYRGVELMDEVFVGPSVVFTNVKRPRAHRPTSPEAYARTLVGRGASIGANATLVCGITVGDHAMIGAGAVVTRDVPPHALVLGVPARQVGYVCCCGARIDLCGTTAECPLCGARYAQEPGTPPERVVSCCCAASRLCALRPSGSVALCGLCSRSVHAGSALCDVLFVRLVRLPCPGSARDA